MFCPIKHDFCVTLLKLVFCVMVCRLQEMEGNRELRQYFVLMQFVQMEREHYISLLEKLISAERFCIATTRV